MNPKGKKSITLTVPKELELTGRELKKIIRQLLTAYHDEFVMIDDELIVKLEAAVL